jgi:hypothetical protein
MGPGIVIPVALIAIVVPVAFIWAKQTFKDRAVGSGDEPVMLPSALLTSKALRTLPTPPWRVVYEIADDKLGGVGHVLIGPPGVFAVTTSMDPLPPPPTSAPDAHAVAESAIARGDLDDALRRCALSSDRLVVVHWGANDSTRPMALDVLPGTIAVDGRRFDSWAASLRDEMLSPAQVDLAWQTVLMAVGRPDPLA